MGSFFKTLTVYTGIILFSLFLSEVTYRLVIGSPVFSTENYLKKAVDRHTRPLSASIIDPDLGWTMRDYFKSNTNSPVPLTTGLHGLRMNVPYQVRQPPRNAILAVGDSFTAGSEEADDGSWPAALERRLEEPVLNGGVGGYGVDQIILRAEKLAGKLSPKIVIYSFLDEDILRSAYEIYGGYKPYFVLTDDDGLELRGVPVEKVPPMLDRLGTLRAVFGHSKMVHDAMTALFPVWWIGRELSFRQVSTNEESVTIACRLMARVRRNAETYGFEPYFILQYGGDRVATGRRSWYAEQTIQCMREAGKRVLDSFDALHTVSQTDFEAFRKLYNERPAERAGPRFGHMSAAGNDFIADLIVETFFN